MEKIIQRLETAKRLCGNIIETLEPFHHICSKEICNPENEDDLIVKGVLSPPALSTDIYLCNYKNHHICNANQCNNTIRGVCPISGACYGNPGGFSSYDKNDYRTWHRNLKISQHAQQIYISENPSIYNNKRKIDEKEKVEEVVAQKKSRRQKPFSQLREIASNVIRCLLYSSIRNKINSRIKNQNERFLIKAVQTYIKSCKKDKSVIDVIYLQKIHDTYTTVENKLEMLVYNEYIVKKYVDIIIATYKNVKKYYSDTFKIETIALGVLYIMRQGYEVENIILFQSDSFLLYNLPSICDIPSFGYDKKNITKGKLIIQYTYNQAFESGVPIKDIQFR